MMTTELYFVIALACIPLCAIGLARRSDMPIDKTDKTDLALFGSVCIVCALLWPVIFGIDIFLLISRLIGRFGSWFSKKKG